MRCALLLAAGAGGVGDGGGKVDGSDGTVLTSLETAEELVAGGSACELIAAGWACELLGASTRLIKPTSSE